MMYRDALLHFTVSEVNPSSIDPHIVNVLDLTRTALKSDPTFSKIKRHVRVDSDEWDGQWNIPDAVIHLIKEMYNIRRTEFL